MWTVWVVALFSAPGVALLLIEPLTFPVALLCFAHAWAVPGSKRDGGPARPLRSGARRASRPGEARRGPSEVALGLLADLVGKDGIDFLN